jgi:hypothetical protein
MTARKVVGIAEIRGVDEEDFESNEFGSASTTGEIILNDSEVGQDFNLVFLVCKWGGECRVELAMNIRKLGEPSNHPNFDGVQIDGFAQLFEGTSEDTDDLDGDVDFQFIVPRGKTIINTQRVTNLDEGGDFADIKMTVTNSAFEE